MSNEEILEKAIRKAIDSGWNPRLVSVRDIIFDHDFAKALWGDEWGSTSDGMEEYKVHLQRMVIADDPIKYLGKHVSD